MSLAKTGVLFMGLALAMATCANAAANKTNGTDLTQIRWAHAVNNYALLNTTLKDKNIDMIEADVYYKTTTNGPVPIMAHPPTNTSDLDLEQFVSNVTHYNQHTKPQKGFKLDFKTAIILPQSKDILLAQTSKINCSLWLNADILEGPNSDPKFNATPVDPDKFLQFASNFKDALLSIGWTTHVSPLVTNLSYTAEHVDKMLAVLKAHNITQHVTFPVRAGLAANSRDQMLRLVKSWPNSTLTLWMSNPLDHVDVANLKDLLKRVGRNSTYLDVPEDLRKKLLGNSSPTVVCSMVTIIAALAISRLF